MELKEKIELLSKRADIVNKKLIALMVIDGAIWIYGVKGDGLLFWVGLVAFGITAFATISNLLKLGDIDKKLEKLEKGVLDE